jgi:hypothetical protein
MSAITLDGFEIFKLPTGTKIHTPAASEAMAVVHKPVARP